MWFSCLVASTAAFMAQQQRPRYALHAVDVSLEKPLGMVLEENVRDAPEGLYVAEIDTDGSASACAEIKVDDRLDAVNGVDTTSMGFDDIMDLIVDAPSPVRLQFSGPTCQLTVVGPKGETNSTSAGSAPPAAAYRSTSNPSRWPMSKCPASWKFWRRR